MVDGGCVLSGEQSWVGVRDLMTVKAKFHLDICSELA